jgi:hypothetical protein
VRKRPKLKALLRKNCKMLELHFAMLAGVPILRGFARLLRLNAEWTPAIKTLSQVRLAVLRLAIVIRLTSSLFNRTATDASWNALPTLWLQLVDNLVCPKTAASSW